MTPQYHFGYFNMDILEIKFFLEVQEEDMEVEKEFILSLSFIGC